MSGQFTFPDQEPGDNRLRSSTEHQERAMQLMQGAKYLTTGSSTEQLTAAQVHLLAAILACVRKEQAHPEADSAARHEASQHSCQSPRPPARVRVFHDAEQLAMVHGESMQRAVVEVYAYDDPDVSPATTDHDLTERAFHLFNVGHDSDFGRPDHRALEYRERGNRSLSVGDVVAIDGRFHVCRPTGWEPIDPPQQVCSPQAGTTPLY